MKTPTMGGYVFARGVIVTACALSVIGTSASSTAAADAPQTVRILIVGDSLTHGSAGDWTWRYRLWEHFKSAGVSVDFVGPRDDVFDRRADAPGSHAYLDPDFDREHAATWGMRLTPRSQEIADLVRDYQPDVVLELLGLNELVDARVPAGQVNDRLTGFVAAARSADPQVDLVLGGLPHVWRAPVAEFTKGLPGLARSLDTAGSRVIAASTHRGFSERRDTYDTNHPSARGEVKIAAGFADALSRLGIGPGYRRPLPRVRNGPHWPATLQARSGDRSAVLRWSNPPGVTGQFVWIRHRKGPWTRQSIAVTGNSWRVRGLANFHRYRIRLQATNWNAVARGVFSNVVALRPTPPAVSGLTVKRGERQLRVRWNQVRSVGGYRVAWWPRGQSRKANAVVTKRTRLVLKGLRAGRPYRVKVATVTYGKRGPAATITARRAS
jgi:hypothetical protein